MLSRRLVRVLPDYSSTHHLAGNNLWLPARDGAIVTVNVTVNKERPVNLDLGAFRWPVTAIASILHRISGILLFVGVGFLIWGLGASLESQESFESVKECLSGVLPKLILWGILAGLIYHFIAGCKHLLMDIGIGETLEGGRLGARIVLGLSVVLIVLAGVWIW